MAVKKKGTKKRPVRKEKDVPKVKNMVVSERKVRRTTNALLYSGITFILSFILFVVSVKDSFIESLFGFIMILSGALVILFVILEVIFFFMKK